MQTSFASKSAANAVAVLSTTLGGVLSSVIVARLLGVEGVGMVAFATWAVTIVLALFDLGVPGALARFLPELHALDRPEQAHGLAAILFRWFVAANLVAAFTFISYTMWLSYSPKAAGPGELGQPAFWALVAAAVLAQALAGFAYGYLKGTQQFAFMARLAAVSGLIQIATTACGAVLFGVYGAMAAAVTGYVLPALILTRLSRGSPIARELKKRVARFCWQTWAICLVSAVAWSRMEVFFLQRSWGAEAVGLFTVSLTLSQLATQVPLLFLGALTPLLSSQQGDDRIAKMRDIYLTATRLLALFVLPACIGLLAITPVLLPAVFGDAFAPATPVAVVLVGASAFSAMASVATTYLYAMERTRFPLVISGACAFLSIVAGLTVIPAYGATGAALARAATQAMFAIALVWYVSHALHSAPPIRELSRLFLSAAACGACAWLVLRWIDGPAGLLIAIAAGGVVYFACVRQTRALPHSEVEILRSASGALPPRLARITNKAVRLLSR